MARARQSVRKIATPDLQEATTAVWPAAPKADVMDERWSGVPCLAEPRDRVSSLTDVNQVVLELARLSDLSSVPKLKRELSREDHVSPPEAYIVSLIETSMTVQAILDVSPMGEEKTLRFLADLITGGFVTWEESRAPMDSSAGW
jgi:hypothetical protein